jgi:hypothetical protein
MRFLIDKIRDHRKMGQALMDAVREGNEPRTRALLEAGVSPRLWFVKQPRCDVGFPITPVEQALIAHDLPVLSVLLEHGAPVQQQALEGFVHEVIQTYHTGKNEAWYLAAAEALSASGLSWKQKIGNRAGYADSAVRASDILQKDCPEFWADSEPYRMAKNLENKLPEGRPAMKVRL